MGDFLIWTWVVCGTPLALALLEWGVQWTYHAFHARMIAPISAAGEPSASGSALLWTRV